MIVRGTDFKMVSSSAKANESTVRACDHCGLPVPKALLNPPTEESFCCNGCAMAWQLIHENGLEAWYEMREAFPVSVDSVGQSTNGECGFSEFDEESFQNLFVTSENDSSVATLALSGLHCAACIWLIEKLPAIVPGVLSATVAWGSATVRIEWDRERVRLSHVAETLNQLGYRPGVLNSNHKSENRRYENRRQLVRIGIAAAAAGNNMLIAAALYLGMFQYMTQDMNTLLRVASCVIGLISFLGPGRVFLKGAVAALRTRTPHMDLPIALALLVGTLAGLVNTLRGTGEIYFDSLSVLIFLLLLGRWIQFRQQNMATDAVELLYRLTPSRARRVTDGRVESVATDSLNTGDWVEVRPGELIPVDGVVEKGDSFVDEQLLTGESGPLVKGCGDAVHAGTNNIDGVLTIRAIQTGKQTRIAGIARLVQQASESRPKIVEWANRIAGHFVIVVMSLSILTLAGWMMIDPSVAVDRMVALLVVACPCALAMATPLSIAVATGRLARQGILVKSGDVLQLLNRPGMIWLDKTGTLTEGKLRVVRWEGDAKWQGVVAAIESRFSHPVARALTGYANAKKAASDSIKNPRSGPDGVTAKFERMEFAIGNIRLMQSRGARFSDSFQRAANEFTEQQLSPCWIAVDGKVVAVAGLGDSIRVDSHKTLDELKEMGWKVGILSGDHSDIVTSVAQELGGGFENVFGSVSPEQKLEVIRNCSHDLSPVVMVGDGVNDSAALAMATVGIAVHGGAEASLAAAPVYLGQPGLGPLVTLIKASRSTWRTIQLNFSISLLYNMAGVGLAITGVINPLVAALLMPLSSLTVIGLSLRSSNGRA